MATGQGRTGATALVLLAALLLFPVVQSDYGTFDVGGDAGWSFGVDRWAKGKTFKVGDQLTFMYDPWRHNVAVVDARDFSMCRATPNRSKIYSSGYDVFHVARGTTYFICGVPGHCRAGGMKLAVVAP